MKRIKKEFLPEILRADDGRKTADLFPILSELAELREEQKRRAEQREHAERLLRRKDFDKWIEKQKEKATSENDLRHIKYFLYILEQNPAYKVETVMRFTNLCENELYHLTFNFYAVKVNDLRSERI